MHGMFKIQNGYVSPVPYAAGVHTRMFARSFIIQSKDTNSSIVYVTCDLGMLDDGVTQEVTYF